MSLKKILIISNNCFSKTNSNGRTLGNFFVGYSNENLAQFYLQSDEPDFDICQNYFFASDLSVVKSFVKRTAAGSMVYKKTKEKSNNADIPSTQRKIPRNPFTMLLRNFFWKRKAWRGNFNNWVKEFSPEVVLLQAGDAPFLYNIAVEVAKKYEIPLIIYNSEDYYFKNYNYFRNSGITAMFYPIFRRKLKKSVKKAIGYASKSIYISEDLKDIYDKEFNRPSEVIYTSTDVKPVFKNTDKPIFSYLGNLGLDRHIGLIKIANALKRINPDYKLDVYGKIPNDNVKKDFDECQAVNYCGLVTYERVKEVIAESMLVFHTESNDEFYCKDLCHGFSTKIADSLASGTCFCIFAPEMLSCTKYIKKNKCGCVISDEDKLEEDLRDLINNKNLREEYIKNALIMVEKNHQVNKNREKMIKLIEKL